MSLNSRIPAGVELLWDDFHKVVNMTSEELRAWLLIDASGQEAFAPDTGLPLPELGQRVVQLLRKRKVDLTDDDADVMRQIVEFVEDCEANRPSSGACNDRWRHSLMMVGHDPVRL